MHLSLSRKQLQFTHNRLMGSAAIQLQVESLERPPQLTRHRGLVEIQAPGSLFLTLQPKVEIQRGELLEGKHHQRRRQWIFNPGSE